MPEKKHFSFSGFMTPEEKRRLKGEGKKIVEEQSNILKEAFAKTLPPANSPQWADAYRNLRANEEWLRQNREHILAAEAAKRFVVIAGATSGFVECLDCHDILYTWPQDSIRCTCGSLTVTFPGRGRGRPPKITARGDRARNVHLIAKGI